MNAAAASGPKVDLRYKFANINVMLVDSDHRSASLVHQLLMSFGFRKIKIINDGADALKQLRSGRTDLIITEWATGTVGGLPLVKAIRGAKNDKLLRPAIPIIMLTSRSEPESVRAARDAGITEFLAKPFSARTLSNRLVEIIKNPREFVEAPNYSGPSRRRKEGPPPGTEERRLPRGQRSLAADAPPAARYTRPDMTLMELLEGADVLDILSDDVIAEAQADLMNAEGDFINWVKDDIALLETAYKGMVDGNMPEARTQLIRASYTIKAQAGTFGYDMGTIVADLLVNYLNEHATVDENMLVVVRKHIDTIGVIITHRVKDSKSAVGLALIDSLSKLVEKFG